MERALALLGVVIVMIVVVGLLLSLPVMWLWNACFVPAVSGLNEIGWLQAWGILVLCGLLFKTHVTSKE
jgi:hypothetical protein